jgi:GTP cyclohydrolase I
VIDTAKIEAAVRMLLEGIGEDPEREGLKDTPARVARMFKEICGGLESDPTRHLETFFTEQHDEMVLVKNIPIYSICEHHLVPFFGQAHIAYIPTKGEVTWKLDTGDFNWFNFEITEIEYNNYWKYLS